MANNITLTIDEIHAIRVEHSEKTKGLPLEKYRKLLDKEAASVRLAIEHAKRVSQEKAAEL